VKSWGVGSPAKVPLDQMITKRGEYHPENELLWDGSYPFVAGYKGHVAGGWHIQMQDPLEYNKIVADIAYTPTDSLHHGEQLHGDITYSTLFWHLTYRHNFADFYDLFGPTERSRKGDALLFGYHDIPLYDMPRRTDTNFEINLYSGLDTLPGAQNIKSNDRNFAQAKYNITYSDIERSLGAVDDEEGYRVYGEIEEDLAHDRLYTQVHGGFDFGYALSWWKHASAWLYTSAGMSNGDKHNELDYYFMGAFGNNFIDDREIKRYRDYDSFPGFGIDDIAARHFAKATAEFNFPPIRFDDLGNSAFYLSSVRPAAFAGILAADPGNEGHHVMENVGFQLDWNFTVAVRLPMVLSIGDAVGFSGGRAHQNEILVSLKIL
jgi:hypothetical protein